MALVRRNPGTYREAETAALALSADEDFVQRVNGIDYPKRRRYGHRAIAKLTMDATDWLTVQTISVEVEGTSDPLGVTGWSRLARADGAKTGRFYPALRPGSATAHPKAGQMVLPELSITTLTPLAHVRMVYTLEAQARVEGSVSLVETPIVFDRHSSVAFENAAGAGSTNASSLTISAFNPGSDANRALYVWGYHTNSGAGRHNTTGVTFGGSGLTELVDDLDMSASAEAFGFWRYTAPTSTGDIVWTLDDTADVAFLISAMALDGVDQTTPEGTSQTATGTGTALSDTVPTVDSGHLAISGGTTFDSVGSLNGAPGGSGQTQRQNQVIANQEVTTCTEPGAGGTVTITMDANESEPWALISVEVNAAAATARRAIRPIIFNVFSWPTMLLMSAFGWVLNRRITRMR